MEKDKMEKEEIKSLVIDTLERRFESYAQAQIKVHEEAHTKLLGAVVGQIQATVNGKIDGIKKDIKDLSEKINPIDENRRWWLKAKDGAGWVAGFTTSLTLIGGAIFYVINKIK